MERILAAILMADVVGYSRLIGTDEEATLTALDVGREIFPDCIESHGGAAGRTYAFLAAEYIYLNQMKEARTEANMDSNPYYRLG